MLDKTRLAVRRLLTMSNLCENLYELYGEREVLRLAAPARYRLFPSQDLTYGDCLRFTNLTAEAFINDLDLKKGERAVLCISDPAELLLVSLALMKAGGIAVPLERGSPEDEMRRCAAGCGATLAVMDGRLLAERPHLAAGMAGVERSMASGPCREAPAGTPSLDRAMEGSSGFFLPYTLKPANVAGLFYTRMRDGSWKSVMATNQGLLAPRRAAPFLLPARPGDLCLCALPLTSMAGFAAATLALAMGLRLSFVDEGEPEAALRALAGEKPAVFMGTPRIYARLLEAGASGRDVSSVRLWFCSETALNRDEAAALGRLGAVRIGPLRLPAPVVEAYDAGGNAIMLALKPWLPGLAWEAGSPGVVLPPNRMRTVDGSDRRSKQSRGGELAVRGPAVTPGYWNDLEGTLHIKRDGWLHTGLTSHP